MPMIAVYAAAGTFADEHQLAVDLASALMKIEKVPTSRCSGRTQPRSSTSSLPGPWPTWRATARPSRTRQPATPQQLTEGRADAPVQGDRGQKSGPLGDF
jgi:hypothetical protein